MLVDAHSYCLVANCLIAGTFHCQVLHYGDNKQYNIKNIVNTAVGNSLAQLLRKRSASPVSNDDAARFKALGMHPMTDRSVPRGLDMAATVLRSQHIDGAKIEAWMQRQKERWLQATGDSRPDPVAATQARRGANPAANLFHIGKHGSSSGLRTLKPFRQTARTVVINRTPLLTTGVNPPGAGACFCLSRTSFQMRRSHPPSSSTPWRPVMHGATPGVSFTSWIKQK